MSKDSMATAERAAGMVRRALMQELDRNRNATAGDVLQGAFAQIVALAVVWGGRDGAMDLILDAAHSIRHSPALSALELAGAEPAGRA